MLRSRKKHKKKVINLSKYFISNIIIKESGKTSEARMETLPGYSTSEWAFKRNFVNPSLSIKSFKNNFFISVKDISDLQSLKYKDLKEA